jgi:formylglycine-generating enzyme required for sulfatase activity
MLRNVLIPLLPGFLFAFDLLSLEFSTVAAEPNPVGMVWMAGGTFTMEAICPEGKRNEQPAHKVVVEDG